MKYVEIGTWHDMYIEAIDFKLRNMHFQNVILVSNEQFPSGAHIRGGVRGGGVTSLAENCKKSVQIVKIVEKVGPISRSREV